MCLDHYDGTSDGATGAEQHPCDIQLIQEMIQKAPCSIVVFSVCWKGGVYSTRCYSRVLAESEHGYINVDTTDGFHHIH